MIWVVYGWSVGSTVSVWLFMMEFNDRNSGHDSRAKAVSIRKRYASHSNSHNKKRFKTKRYIFTNMIDTEETAKWG